MADLNVTADLQVEDEGTPRALNVADFGTAALLAALADKLELSDLAALATAAKQDAAQVTLAALLVKLPADPATQTTLAALLTELGQKVEPSDLTALATSAKQDTAQSSLTSLVAKDYATGAKQDTAQTSLTMLAAKDYSTQTTLAAVLAKLSSDPATQTTLASVLTKLNASIAVTGPVTDTQLRASAVPVDGSAVTQPVSASALTTLAAKDFSTQTTLAAVLAKLTSDPATQTTLAAVLAKLTSDPATQTTLAAILTKLNATLDVGDRSARLLGHVTNDNQPSLIDGNGEIGYVRVPGIWYDDSVTPLTGNATFTGTARDLTGAAANSRYTNYGVGQVRVGSASDVAGTLAVEVSRDSSTWRRVQQSTATQFGGTGLFCAQITYIPWTRYMRVIYVNGAGAQANFTLNSISVST